MANVNNQIYQHLNDLENKEKFTEAKIKKLDRELDEIKVGMSKATNPSAKDRLKDKARGILQQKKNFENELNHIRMQSNNLKKTQHSLHQMQDTSKTITLMEQSANVMKNLQSKIGDIDDLQERMWDVNYELNEINQALSANDYSLGDGIDDADLEDELNNLANSMGNSANPAIDVADDSYLLDLDINVPSHKIGASSASGPSSSGYKSKMSQEDRELEKALGL